MKNLDELHKLTKLERLEFHLPYSCRKEVNVIAKLGNPSALKSLLIDDDNGFITFDEESVAKMSNVSNVSIACRDVLFSFTKLPNLESLLISCDRFDDFSTCTKLTWLSIEARGTKRQAPKISAMNHDYQQLTALTNLRYLHLHTGLKDDQFSFLSKMTNLESLKVVEKGVIGLTGQLLEFINSSKLTCLSLPRLKEIEFISHLTSLEEMRIWTGPEKANESVELRNVTSVLLPNMVTLHSFPNLKKLDLVETLIGNQDVSNLTLLSDLVSLRLKAINNEALQLLATLTKLTDLHALFNRQGEKYKFEVLTHLTNMKILILGLDRGNNNGKKLRGKFLWQAMSALTNLEKLSMFHIDENSAGILEKMPNLKHLEVVGKQAAAYDETKLSNLTNLQVLSLTSEYIFDHKPKHECKLSLPYLYNCSD